MKLNVGGQQTIGKFPPGWVCVDILPGADILCNIQNEPLPIEDNVIEAIYCSHTLEHLWPKNVLFTIKEFYRVLIYSGVVRIIVPDMDIAINEYLSKKNTPESILECMNWWFDPTWDRAGDLYLNHVGGFNWPLLRSLMVKAGFINVHRLYYGRCTPSFDGCDNPGHRLTSLYLEASK